MRPLGYVFAAIWMLGFAGNALLFLYTEWRLSGGLSILNPLHHIDIALTLLFMPTFWILLAVTIFGFVGGVIFGGSEPAKPKPDSN